jgi:hypothetical protein
VLPQFFEAAIPDAEFAEAQARHPIIRSKEELHYFLIFSKYFGTEKAVDTVGQWICL